MYIQLRLISILKESEFLPSPKEKSLTGNQSTLAPLSSEGKQQMNDKLHRLFFAVVVKYISNDSQKMRLS
jgi:hypothetical protein